MKEELNMRNHEKPIYPIDEKTKSKKEIEEMINKMMKTDENGYPEKAEHGVKTA